MSLLKTNRGVLVVIQALWGTAFCAGQGALVVERNPIDLPAFASIREMARYATASEYAEAAADSSYSYERLLYKSSDGAIVSGFLYAPKQQSRKFPAIVFSRGSFIVNNRAPLLVTMMRRLARGGYVVFAPMFRGSDGTEGRDEVGGADLNDLRSAVDLVRAMPNVDSDNVFLYGESRGGMMTYFGLRDDFPVRAAAVWGATTDFSETLDLQDPERKLARTIWENYDAIRERVEENRSAIRWPEKIRKPILIMHGGEDELSPRQSLKMAEALTRLKRTYSLVIFANDNHGLHQNRHQRDQLAIDWFDQHQSKAR